jgi:hypothetical protein
MSTTLPIILTPVPVPVTVKAININQLLVIISQYMQASVSAEVSFFQITAADPTSMTSLIIFNSSQRVFKVWDESLGKYIAISSFQPGDIKYTFSGGDSPQTGWVECDGRLIADVPGISQTQQGMLIALFPSGSLPNISVMSALNGLPADGAFTAVSVADVQPPDNQIANLPFSADYNPAEGANLASNTEVLRDSQNELRTALVSLRDLSNQTLAALSGGSSGAPIYAHVFVGYP